MVQHYILQRSIEVAINKPHYTAALPPLPDEAWMRILARTTQARAENDRLEFIGDALMYATLAPMMHAQYPNGTPHLYTCVRAVLHSNATFSLLAEKLDIMAVSSPVLQALTQRTFGEGALAPHKSRPAVKATADLFETVIGVYYLNYGFDALYKWVEGIYAPLIKAVTETFYAYQNGPGGTVRGPGMKKRTVEPFMYTPGNLSSGAIVCQSPNAPLKKKTQVAPVKQRIRALEKISAARARSSRSSSLKTAVLGSPSLNSKVVPAKQRAQFKPSTSTNVAVPIVKKAPTFIDLTADSDSDDCEPRPSYRHPLVMPRLPRRTSAVYPVFKLPTPVAVPTPPSIATASAPPALVVADAGGRSSSCSETEDEVMLETMLTADAESDMDCGSSDVHSPARPPNLAQFLVKADIGTGGGVRDIFQPWQMRRDIFLR